MNAAREKTTNESWMIAAMIEWCSVGQSLNLKSSSSLILLETHSVNSRRAGARSQAKSSARRSLSDRPTAAKAHLE